MAEALTLCRELVADDITTVIATPHQLGRYEGRNSAAEIRRAVGDLDEALSAEAQPLRVLPGADVRIDERIPDLLARDEVMTLADGGKYLLVELPRQAVINPVGLARELAPMGVTVILTHPERCEHLCRHPDSVFAWLQEGIHLQLTAGGIVGEFGPLAQEACWYWLSRAMASLVASDAHGGKDRRPCMSSAFEAVSARISPAAARQVCIDNPLAVLLGRRIGSI